MQASVFDLLSSYFICYRLKCKQDFSLFSGTLNGFHFLVLSESALVPVYVELITPYPS